MAVSSNWAEGGLAWRPLHLAPAEDVKMKMINGLATVLTGVNHDPIAVFETFLLCDSLYSQ